MQSDFSQELPEDSEEIPPYQDSSDRQDFLDPAQNVRTLFASAFLYFVLQGLPTLDIAKNIVDDVVGGSPQEGASQADPDSALIDQSNESAFVPIQRKHSIP